MYSKRAANGAYMMPRPYGWWKWGGIGQFKTSLIGCCYSSLELRIGLAVSPAAPAYHVSYESAQLLE